MKKIALFALLGTALFAIDTLESGNKLVQKKIVCDSGSAGFEFFITNEKVSTKEVYYNSCDSYQGKKFNGEISVNTVEPTSPSLNGQTNVTINGVEYYFPNGYVEPTVEADGSCTGGYTNTSIKSGFLNCYSGRGDFMGEGWLNLTDAKNTQLGILFASNVDNLANLTKAHQINLYSPRNLNGLSNLQEINLIDADNASGLSDINGLSNVTNVRYHIGLQDREYTNKLDADSYLCNEGLSKMRFKRSNPAPGESTFYSATEADKSKICN